MCQPKPIFADIDTRYNDTDIENIFTEKQDYSSEQLQIIRTILHSMSTKSKFENRRDYDRTLNTELRKYKGILHKFPTKIELNILYQKLIKSGVLDRNIQLEKFMKRKFCRSSSGELPVTVFTSPSNFDCPEDCFYCPDEKEEKIVFDPKSNKEIKKKVRIQPRSYLSTEPGCRRAARDKFHPVLQAYDRIHSLQIMGHEPDKIRFIVLGGTYCYYPMDYRIWFMTSLYYACNTYYYWDNKRAMKSLEEEMRENRDSSMRIVGISVETRPDRCTLDDCAHFMNCGITTVQLGIQQLDNKILKGINRRCTIDQIKSGTKRILDCGLKLDAHYMFDLPGPGKVCALSPNQDIEMVDKITGDPDFSVADQWKLYPTSTTPYTKILDWYNNMVEFTGELKMKFNAIIIQSFVRKKFKFGPPNGESQINLEKKKYLPYAEIDGGSYLIDVIVYAKQKVHKDTRLNRIIRDIPEISIVGGNKTTNLRQTVLEKIDRDGLRPCQCIRCREIQGGEANISDLVLDVYERVKAGSPDLFVSFEDKYGKLYGLARLRLLNDTSDCLELLKNSAIIREVHVYGSIVRTNKKESDKVQHNGLGKRLIKECEAIAYKRGYKDIFITSGEGVINYYRDKLGYQLVAKQHNNIEYHYMYKNLNFHDLMSIQWEDRILIILLVVCGLMYLAKNII